VAVGLQVREQPRFRRIRRRGIQYSGDSVGYVFVQLENALVAAVPKDFKKITALYGSGPKPLGA
jgi:hypothetical protein